MTDNTPYDVLPPEDSLKKIFDLQKGLQERLGRMALSREADMKGKSNMIIQEIFYLNTELSELMYEMPFKNWKSYNDEELKDWANTEHRNNTLEEYIDALHFFINIALVLNFSPEEVFEMYKEKNRINHKRQDRNY